MAPVSRRSESCGRLSARASGFRLSWLSATTGMLQLLREQLQAAADLGDLLLAVVGTPGVRARHELQVVDDDEVQAAAARAHAPGLRADVHDVHVAGVDDVQGRVVQHLGCVHDVRPVLRSDALAADPVPWHLCLRAQDPHADLGARHLQREDGDRVAVDGDVARHVHGERGLPDARPRRDHDEVPRLQPRREVVQVAEPGRQARVGGVAVLDGLEVHHGLVDQVAEDRHLVLVLAPRDVVDPLLGVVRPPAPASPKASTSIAAGVNARNQRCALNFTLPWASITAEMMST